MTDYRHDNSTAPGIAQAHTIYGEPVTASLRQEMVNEGTTRQVQSFFRNYEPPKRREHDKGHRLCAEEGCKAYPATGKNYCAGHGRVHGEVKTCKHRECKAPPRSGTDYCRWHSAPITEEPTDEPD